MDFPPRVSLAGSSDELVGEGLSNITFSYFSVRERDRNPESPQSELLRLLSSLPPESRSDRDSKACISTSHAVVGEGGENGGYVGDVHPSETELTPDKASLKVI